MAHRSRSPLTSDPAWRGHAPQQNFQLLRSLLLDATKELAGLRERSLKTRPSAPAQTDATAVLDRCLQLHREIEQISIHLQGQFSQLDVTRTSLERRLEQCRPLSPRGETIIIDTVTAVPVEGRGLADLRVENDMLRECILSLEAQLRIDAMKHRQFASEWSTFSAESDEALLQKKKAEIKFQLMQEIEAQTNESRMLQEELNRKGRELQVQQSIVEHRIISQVRDAHRTREQALHDVSIKLAERERAAADHARALDERDKRLTARESELDVAVRRRDMGATDKQRLLDELERGLQRREAEAAEKEASLRERLAEADRVDKQLRELGALMNARQAELDKRDNQTRVVNQQVEHHVSAVESYASQVAADANAKLATARLKETELVKMEVALKEEWKVAEQQRLAAEAVKRQSHALTAALEMKGKELESKELEIASLSTQQQQFVTLMREEHEGRLRALDEARGQLEQERAFLADQKAQIDTWRAELRVREEQAQSIRAKAERESDAATKRDQQASEALDRCRLWEAKLRKREEFVDNLQVQNIDLIKSTQALEERLAGSVKEHQMKCEELMQARKICDDLLLKARLAEELQAIVAQYRHREGAAREQEEALAQRALQLDDAQRRLHLQEEQLKRKEMEYLANMKAAEDRLRQQLEYKEHQLLVTTEQRFHSEFKERITTITRERNTFAAERDELNRQLCDMREEWKQFTASTTADIQHKAGELNNLLVQKTQVESRVRQLHEENEEWRAKFQALEASMEGLIEENFKKNRDKDNDLAKRIHLASESWQSKVRGLNQQIEEYSLKTGILEKECTQWKTLHQEQQTQISILTRQISSKDESLRQENAKEQSLLADLAAVEFANRALGEQLERAEAEHTSRVSVFMKDAREREMRIEELIAEIKEKERKLLECEERIGVLLHESRAHSGRIQTLNNEVTDTEAALRLTNGELSSCKERLALCECDNDRRSARIRELEKLCDDFRQQVSFANTRMELVREESERTVEEIALRRVEAARLDITVEIQSKLDTEFEVRVDHFQHEMAAIAKEKERCVLECERYKRELAAKANVVSVFERQVAEMMSQLNRLGEIEVKYFDLQASHSSSRAESERLQKLVSDLETTLSAQRKKYDLLVSSRESEDKIEDLQAQLLLERGRRSKIEQESARLNAELTASNLALQERESEYSSRLSSAARQHARAVDELKAAQAELSQKFSSKTVELSNTEQRWRHDVYINEMTTSSLSKHFLDFLSLQRLQYAALHMEVLSGCRSVLEATMFAAKSEQKSPIADYRKDLELLHEKKEEVRATLALLSVEAERSRLQLQVEELERRKSEVDGLQREVQRRETAVRELEASLKNRDSLVSASEHEVREGMAALQSQQTELLRLEQTLQKRSVMLLEGESRLEQDTHRLSLRAMKVNDLEQSRDERVQVLEAERGKIKERLDALLREYSIHIISEDIVEIVDIIRNTVRDRITEFSLEKNLWERDVIAREKGLADRERRARDVNVSLRDTFQKEVRLFLQTEFAERTLLEAKELQARAVGLAECRPKSSPANLYSSWEYSSIVLQVEQAAKSNERHAELLRKEAEFLTRERVELDGRAQQLRKKEEELEAHRAQQSQRDESQALLELKVGDIDDAPDNSKVDIIDEYVLSSEYISSSHYYNKALEMDSRRSPLFVPSRPLDPITSYPLIMHSSPILDAPIMTREVQQAPISSSSYLMHSITPMFVGESYYTPQPQATMASAMAAGTYSSSASIDEAHWVLRQKTKTVTMSVPSDEWEFVQQRMGQRMHTYSPTIASSSSYVHSPIPMAPIISI